MSSLGHEPLMDDTAKRTTQLHLQYLPFHLLWSHYQSAPLEKATFFGSSPSNVGRVIRENLPFPLVVRICWRIMSFLGGC
jgi:hypothetical protein